MRVYVCMSVYVEVFRPSTSNSRSDNRREDDGVVIRSLEVKVDGQLLTPFRVSDRIGVRVCSKELARHLG